MALPKVTPGTYNYGQYANPTQVKYKGGQQAIGKAIGTMIGAGIKNKKETEKKEFELNQKGQKAGSDTVIKLYETYGEDINSLAAENQKTALNLLNSIGDLEASNVTGKVSTDDYTKNRIRLQSDLQSLLLLGDVNEAAFAGEVVQQEHRQENFDRNAGFNSAMANQAYKVYRKDGKDDGELIISWKGVGDGTKESARQQYEYPLKEVMYNNKDFLNLQEKFKFESGKPFEHLQEAGKLFDANSDEFMSSVMSNSSGSYAALDIEKARQSLLDPQSSNSFIVDNYVKAYGKDIFKDFVKTRDDYEGEDYSSPEVQSILRETVADQVLKVAKKKGAKVPEPKEPTVDKPAKWEIDMAELKQEQEQLVTNPISQRQWDNIVKPRPSKSYEGGAEGQSTASLDDMSLTAMSQLASKYDFTIVGEPLLDKAGTKEIGFELQDNKTKEKIRIYKSFSVDQVMEELKKAKNVSDSNKVQLP